MTINPPLAPTPPPLFFQRRFLPMWTALALGAFTDNMLKQALSIALVYGVLSAPMISNDDALPIIGSLFPIAMLLFSTIAGQLADKYETSFLFRRTKFAEFLLMILAAAGFLMNNSFILILALFLMGAQSAFFSPVRTSAMPKYLRANELVRGNALCSGGLFVSVMIGIVVGNVLITTPNGAGIVSLILIVAALAGWLAIRLAPEAAANAPELKVDWNGFAQAVKLIGFAASSRGVARPVLGVAWYWSVGALVTVAVPLFVRDELFGAPGVVAVMMVLFTIGAAIGAIGASLLSKSRTGLGFSTAGAAGASLMTFCVFIIASGYPPPPDRALQTIHMFFDNWRAWLLTGTFVLAAISTSVFVVPLQAAVQRRAPPERRARILAANNMANALGAMIGSLLVLSATRTSLNYVDLFFAVGVAQAVLAIYMLRRKKSVPEGLFDEMLASSDAAPGVDAAVKAV